MHEPVKIVAEIYQRFSNGGRLDRSTAGHCFGSMDMSRASWISAAHASEYATHPFIVVSRAAPPWHRTHVVISPFYLIEDTGPASYPVFIMAVYFLLGIEMVAEDIEEPFQAGGDNLPLERYAATIESSVREILGGDGPIV